MGSETSVYESMIRQNIMVLGLGPSVSAQVVKIFTKLSEWQVRKKRFINFPKEEKDQAPIQAMAPSLR
jgi:hypothetical protein